MTLSDSSLNKRILENAETTANKNGIPDSMIQVVSWDWGKIPLYARHSSSSSSSFPSSFPVYVERCKFEMGPLFGDYSLIIGSDVLYEDTRKYFYVFDPLLCIHSTPVSTATC